MNIVASKDLSHNAQSTFSFLKAYLIRSEAKEGKNRRRLNLASVEKMFKLLLEEIQQGTAPLSKVVQNQEIMIIQNKQIIELYWEQVRLSSSEDNT